MKKILTIDFDILMHNVIEIYNDKIDTEEYTVDSFIKDFPNFKEHLYPDLFLYQYLTEILREHKNSIFYFVDSHEKIIDYLDKNEESIVIYNIDHHSDVNYDEADENVKITEAVCGNWVKWLVDNGYNIFDYCWIYDKHSELDSGYNLDLINESFLIGEKTLSNLEFDKIVICKSPEWVPYTVLPLYDLWQEEFDIQ